MAFQIYTLSHPETGEVRYVGKTEKGLQARLRGHVKAAKRAIKKGRSSYLYNWINSFSSDPVIEEIEEFTSKQTLNEGEVFYISYFRFIGMRLVNATDGGEGRNGAKASEETKKKMSVAQMGKSRNNGAIRSEELKIQISRKEGGAPFGDQYGTVYETLRGASKEFGFDRANVKRVLDGKQKHYKGFIFKYLDGYENRKRPISPNKGKPLSKEARSKISKSLGGRPFIDQFGKRYETTTEASRLLNLTQSHVWAVLKGREKSTKGFVFKYIESQS